MREGTSPPQGSGGDGRADRQDSDTVSYLRRWHSGDRSALDFLLERDMPWIREHVHSRLGRRLQKKAEAEDYLQDVLIEVLRYCPKFMVPGRKQFCALIGSIAESVLCNHADYFSARRRDMDRESNLPTDSVFDLGTGTLHGERPSEIAVRHEEEAALRIGLELLSPDDRRIVLLRDWDDVPYEDIGREFEISEDAARMRHKRALKKLLREIDALGAGESAEGST
ncbi:MAG: RNA polymerase sigma factor [Planctomycetota bacterium]|jgi:RNA polymerase sigma-70 factor (ECF subfamily)